MNYGVVDGGRGVLIGSLQSIHSIDSIERVNWIHRRRLGNRWDWCWLSPGSWVPLDWQHWEDRLHLHRESTAQTGLTRKLFQSTITNQLGFILYRWDVEIWLGICWIEWRYPPSVSGSCKDRFEGGEGVGRRRRGVVSHLICHFSQRFFRIFQDSSGFFRIFQDFSGLFGIFLEAVCDGSWWKLIQDFTGIL